MKRITLKEKCERLEEENAKLLERAIKASEIFDLSLGYLELDIKNGMDKPHRGTTVVLRRALKDAMAMLEKDDLPHTFDRVIKIAQEKYEWKIKSKCRRLAEMLEKEIGVISEFIEK